MKQTKTVRLNFLNAKTARLNLAFNTGEEHG